MTVSLIGLFLFLLEITKKKVCLHNKLIPSSHSNKMFIVFFIFKALSGNRVFDRNTTDLVYSILRLQVTSGCMIVTTLTLFLFYFKASGDNIV